MNSCCNVTLMDSNYVFVSAAKETLLSLTFSFLFESLLRLFVFFLAGRGLAFVCEVWVKFRYETPNVRHFCSSSPFDF